MTNLDLTGLSGRHDILEMLVTDSLEYSGHVKRRAANTIGGDVLVAAANLARCLRSGGRGFIVGNGGSAADAQHFAAEFTGRFRNSRNPLPVLALTTDTSVLTCISNDYDFAHVFSRQIEALGAPGDVLFVLSTSGESSNVIEAARAARNNGLYVIGLTGQRDCSLDQVSDLAIKVPSPITARVQECQMSILHVVCDLGERFLGHEESFGAVEGQDQLTRLVALRGEWRKQGLTLVTTNGCFDVLHAGHLDSLKRAAEFGDVLAVLVNSDDSVRKLKGADRPINSLKNRMDMLGALAPVSYVLEFSDDDPSEILRQLQPEVHCKGEDYRERPDVPEAQVLAEYGGRMEFLPLMHGLSSTSVIESTGPGTA